MAMYLGKQKVCPVVKVGGGAPINNQDKTITENGTYTADSGYTGLGEVTVNVPTSSIPSWEEGYLIGYVQERRDSYPVYYKTFPSGEQYTAYIATYSNNLLYMQYTIPPLVP